ncbi:hypothetical protein HK405_001648, partial [Cladochytrium tenue]
MDVKKVLLAPSTHEFAYLEYGLQLALRSSTTRIITAHTISNPHLSAQFEKRCKDILVLNSWLDVSQLVGGNTEDEVIRRGFQFSSTNLGMKFPVGTLQARSIQGVGRARVVDPTTAERDPVPDKYD